MRRFRADHRGNMKECEGIDLGQSPRLGFRKVVVQCSRFEVVSPVGFKNKLRKL
ncbi:hypothetical protein LINPERPRIM_LOCUS5357 [Linum perenne]